jgi:hypothetical protein
MSKHRLFIFILLFGIASVVGVVVLVGMRFYVQNACPYEELRLCRFERLLKNEKFEKVSGIYINKTNGKDVTTDFNFHGKNQEIYLRKDAKEILHMIESGEYIYLSSPNDLKWRRQRVSIAESYEYLQPSGVHGFLVLLKKWFLETEMTATFIEKTLCEGKTCYRYELKVVDLPVVSSIYLTEKNTLAKIIIEDERGTQEIIFTDKNKEILLPESFEVAGNENIFLQITSKEEEKSVDYQYVEQFEKERKQAE